MSGVLDKVKGLEHTFTGWLMKQYTKIYNAEPKIERIAEGALTYVIKAVQIGLAAEGQGALAAEVGSVATQVVGDVHVAGALIHDFGPTPTATSMLVGIQDNLNGLITGSHIKNKDSVDAVTKAVGTLGGLVALMTTAAPTQ